MCSGSTGHLESVEVIFDPEKISYKKLLYYFWNNIDPTDAYGQFCDQGSSYKSAIFCSKDQCPVAQDSLMELKASHPYWTIATKIIESKTFWPAEDYHQNYYKKNPGRYSYYKNACGRTSTLKSLWGAKEFQEAHKDETFHADPENPHTGKAIAIILLLVAVCLVCVFAFNRKN